MNDVVTTPPSDAKSTTPNPKWSPTPTDDGGASEVIVWSKETPSTVSAAPNASQRPTVVPQKPAFSPSPLILNRNSLAGTPSSTQAPAEENGWHFISSGQLVDDTGSQYDIAEQVMKLQINDDKSEPAKPLETSSEQTKVPNGATEETETPSTSPHNDPYVLHSRGPSSDTSSSDGTSSVVTPLHLKSQTNIPVEDGERDRNGYLSEAGVRLEALHSAQKELFAAPPEFPSLQQHSHQTYPQVPPQQHGALGLGRPPHIGVVPGYDYRQHPHQHQHQHQRSDDLQVDYNIQPRPYGPGAAAPQAPQTFAPLPMHPRQDMPFRPQAPRGSISGGQYAMAPPPPPSIIGSPPPAAYYQAPALYDLVHPHPHQALRPTHHHHSASDPSSLRDIAAMHAMHSPPPMHPFTPNQGIYTPVTSPLPYGAPAQFYDRMPPPPPPPPFVGNYSVDGAGLAAGPSANNRKLGLYKTELCRSWEEKGSCRYGPKCQFAHGEEEIRKVARHPKYKTEICRTFWVSGSCPYGKRCCFIHTELPASGAPGAPGAAGAAPADESRNVSSSHPDGRARSMSTNSDPNDPPSSLLARISAKRNEAATTATTTGSANTTAEFPSFGRPANGTLRVDTAVENATKQNGGQYPYTSNPAIPAPGSELHHRMSPAPATASADFGRGRIDVVGYNSRIPPPNGHGHGLRHSFGGDTTITPIAQRSTSGHSSPFSADGTPSKVSPAPTSGHGVPRNPLATGHSRSGSDLSMPWATQDMPARFERTWA